MRNFGNELIRRDRKFSTCWLPRLFGYGRVGRAVGAVGAGCGGYSHRTDKYFIAELRGRVNPEAKRKAQLFSGLTLDHNPLNCLTVWWSWHIATSVCVSYFAA